jgi:hypothetical protein
MRGENLTNPGSTSVGVNKEGRRYALFFKNEEIEK